MTAGPDERDQIQAAMDRTWQAPLSGPTAPSPWSRYPSKAGVPRNALTQRHTDLKDEFYQRIRERGADNGDEARLRATVAKLRQTIASKNRELAQLSADVPALVRTVSTVTLELQETRAELTALGNITRLDSRRASPRPGDDR